MLSMSSLQAKIRSFFTLFDAQMSVDGGVPGGSGQVLAFPVRNVLAVPLDVPFREAEVQDKYLVTGFVQADAEVIRLDIPVDEVSVVNVFDPLDHLVDQHQHRFQGELSESLVEQRFQRRPHQIHDQNVVVA